MKKLSAIIACYRDAPAIPEMYERLTETFRSIGVDYEIIFVNDASPDNAREVLTELAASDPRVVVVNHTRNFGSQSAFTSGLRIATGDAAILLDGDLQDPPELIADFHEKWREGWDVVYGVRTRRVTTLPMRIAYKAFYRLFRATAYVSVPLDAGDFSLLDRRVIDALNELPESDRFIRGLRAWVGFRQTGVPYVRPERPYGTSTNSLVGNVKWARRAVLSFSYAPLDLIAWLAFVTVGLSIVAALTQIVLRFVDPSLAPKGFTSLLVVILFLGGIQLLCLAIIGSYLAHIYDEVKRRPSYIVESVLNAPRVERRRARREESTPRAMDERRPAVGRHEAPRAVRGGGREARPRHRRRRLHRRERRAAAARRRVRDDAPDRPGLRLLAARRARGGRPDRATRSCRRRLRRRASRRRAPSGSSTLRPTAPTPGKRIARRFSAPTSSGRRTCSKPARQANVEAFVNTGSSSEYGLKEHRANRGRPVEPNSAYAVAKASATMLCRHVAAADGLNVCTLRLYSAYGPWEEPKRLVPALAVEGLHGRLRRSSTRRSHATSCGWATSSTPTCSRREAVHAEPGAVYNVGTGTQTTVGEAAEIARERPRRRGEPGWGSMAARSWDTDCWVADSSKIRRTLNWRPTRGFRAGVRGARLVVPREARAAVLLRHRARMTVARERRTPSRPER